MSLLPGQQSGPAVVAEDGPRHNVPSSADPRHERPQPRSSLLGDRVDHRSLTLRPGRRRRLPGSRPQKTRRPTALVPARTEADHRGERCRLSTGSWRRAALVAGLMLVGNLLATCTLPRGRRCLRFAPATVDDRARGSALTGRAERERRGEDAGGAFGTDGRGERSRTSDRTRRIAVRSLLRVTDPMAC